MLPFPSPTLIAHFYHLTPRTLALSLSNHTQSTHASRAHLPFPFPLSLLCPLTSPLPTIDFPSPIVYSTCVILTTPTPMPTAFPVLAFPFPISLTAHFSQLTPRSALHRLLPLLKLLVLPSFPARRPLSLPVPLSPLTPLRSLLPHSSPTRQKNAPKRAGGGPNPFGTYPPVAPTVYHLCTWESNRLNIRPLVGTQAIKPFPHIQTRYDKAVEGVYGVCGNTDCRPG